MCVWVSGCWYVDNCTCCHIEIEIVNQNSYLTHSQYADTRPTSPSTDPVAPIRVASRVFLSYLSHSLADPWDTTVDFTTSFLHSLWFLAFCNMILHSRPVHSLMLFSHRFLCLPRTVPCRIVLASPVEYQCLSHWYDLPGGRRDRHSTLWDREQSVFNQTNIGTVSRATLGRLLRDKKEHVWAFLSVTLPSWAETETEVGIDPLPTSLEADGLPLGHRDDCRGE